MATLIKCLQKACLGGVLFFFINTCQAMQSTIATGLSGAESILIPVIVSWALGLIMGLTTCAVTIIVMMSSVCRPNGLETHKLHTLSISFIYIVTVSSLYAILGMLAAELGKYLQPYLDSKYLACVFALLFIILSGISIGIIPTFMPVRWIKSLSKFSLNNHSSSYYKAIRFGLFATIIAAPCIIAPLFGTLIYCLYSKNVALAGLTLFFVGVGFGTPLISMYIYGSELIQQAGTWQIHIKQFLGLSLIGVSIWLLKSVIPANYIMYLWSGLVIFTAVHMASLSHIDMYKRQHKEEKAVCSLDGTVVEQSGVKEKNAGAMLTMLILLILLYGILMMVGGMMGNTNPLSPLSNYSEKDNSHEL